MRPVDRIIQCDRISLDIDDPSTRSMMPRESPRMSASLTSEARKRARLRLERARARDYHVTRWLWLWQADKLRYRIEMPLEIENPCALRTSVVGLWEIRFAETATIPRHPLTSPTLSDARRSFKGGVVVRFARAMEEMSAVRGHVINAYQREGVVN